MFNESLSNRFGNEWRFLLGVYTDSVPLRGRADFDVLLAKSKALGIFSVLFHFKRSINLIFCCTCCSFKSYFVFLPAIYHTVFTVHVCHMKQFSWCSDCIWMINGTWVNFGSKTNQVCLAWKQHCGDSGMVLINSVGEKRSMTVPLIHLRNAFQGHGVVHGVLFELTSGLSA